MEITSIIVWTQATYPLLYDIGVVSYLLVALIVTVATAIAVSMYIKNVKNDSAEDATPLSSRDEQGETPDE